MTVLGYMLSIIGGVVVLLLGFRFYKDISWNKKLNRFHQKNHISIPKVPILYWMKRGYGVVLSSFAVVTIAACGVFTLSNDQPSIYLTAKTVGTEEQLRALWQQANYRYDALAEGGPLAPTDAVADDLDTREDRDFIDTNVQVAGVLEADIVKTDGYTIYYATRYQNKIRIIDVLDNGLVDIKEDLDLGNLYTDSLYLTETQLIVIGYVYEYFYFMPEATDDGLDYYYRGFSSFTGAIYVFDRETMELEYSLETDTNFYQHRLIKNSLFLVSNKYMYNEELRPYFEETKDGITVSSYLGYDRMYYFDEVPVYGMTVITSINLSNYQMNSEAFLGEVHQIYASGTAIYSTATIYNYGEEIDSNSPWIWWAPKTYTHIIKYDLDVENAKISYAGRGVVEGHIENQYWMDEFDGYFRIVTSTWGTIQNRLFVLEENSETQTLDIVGSITEGLGKVNERVMSVRFNGTRANVVTFEQIDPLYSIDLTDPKNPFILPNAVEEEGYNTYLHVWNEEHLLIGLGYDGDFQLKLSAYDTSPNNPNPTEPLMTYYLADKDLENIYHYSYSEALHNPKAITVDSEKGIFAFPVNSYRYYFDEEKGYYNYGYQSLFYIFYIDFSNENEAIIADPIIVAHDEFNYYSGIDRGVYINNVIYTLSFAQLVSYSLLTQTVLETITFSGMEEYQYPIYAVDPDKDEDDSIDGEADEPVDQEEPRP
jgi:inhibitor of cysteine peptidase